MAVAALYNLHGIVSSNPAFFLSQITNARATPGITVQKGIPAGLPGALSAYNLGQSLDFTFDTTQVKTVLDLETQGTRDEMCRRAAEYQVNAILKRPGFDAYFEGCP